MQIDKELILKLENLAQLELSDSEREKIRKDLNDILTMVEKLKEVDTQGVEPLVYLNQEGNVWREDQAEQIPGIREKAMQNAPDADEQFFKVPKVLDH